MVPLTGGNIIAGKYRLERMLARGGMGAVWLGRHLPLEIDVAIKLMKADQAASPGWRMRFRREAKAAAQLKIPNVVQVYDYGLEGDVPYMVMELLEGEDLATLLGREKRLGLAATRSIIDQVCLALARAHATGLVHRDLKPANIFLACQGGTEIVKILDFGIAKFTGPDAVEGATETGALLGSPHYMSPEQVRNSKGVDHRSDLWALGVIVFRCITGKLPFPGKEVGDVLVEVCTAPVPVPSQHVEGIGPQVDRFMLRALTRDPSARFQSAEEFARAFAEVVAAANTPSSVAPPTLTVAGSSVLPGISTAAPLQTKEGARRKRVAFVALASAIGLLVGVPAFVLSQRSGPAAEAVVSDPGARAPAPSAAGSSHAAPEVSPPVGAASLNSAPPDAAAPSGAPSAASAPPRTQRPSKGPPARPTATPRNPSRKADDPLNEM